MSDSEWSGFHLAGGLCLNDEIGQTEGLCIVSLTMPQQRLLRFRLLLLDCVIPLSQQYQVVMTSVYNMYKYKTKKKSIAPIGN